MIRRQFTRSSLLLLSVIRSSVPITAFLALTGASSYYRSSVIYLSADKSGISSSTANGEDREIILSMEDDKILTTNEEDQAAAAALTSRLSQTTAARKSPVSSDFVKIPSVSIDDGAHKYVLVSAVEPSASANGTTKYFVKSKRGASYHRNAAEPLVAELEANGYGNINVTGGGRIFRDDDEKKISVFGFSYGFGKADHRLSKKIIQRDERFKDYVVTASDEGY